MFIFLTLQYGGTALKPHYVPFYAHKMVQLDLNFGYCKFSLLK